MRVIYRLLIVCFDLYKSERAFGQKLHPGYDPVEYFELLKISSRQGDTLYNPDLPSSREDTRVPTVLPVMGLDNRWELWESEGFGRS